jgi:hypothetical protein
MTCATGPRWTHRTTSLRLRIRRDSHGEYGPRIERSGNQQVRHEFCKPICKPDAAGWVKMGETPTLEVDPRHIRRGQHDHRRPRETAETHVVWLITQRSQVQLMPPLPRAQPGAPRGTHLGRDHIKARSQASRRFTTLTARRSAALRPIRPTSPTKTGPVSTPSLILSSKPSDQITPRTSRDVQPVGSEPLTVLSQTGKTALDLSVLTGRPIPRPAQPATADSPDAWHETTEQMEAAAPRPGSIGLGCMRPHGIYAGWRPGPRPRALPSAEVNGQPQAGVSAVLKTARSGDRPPGFESLALRLMFGNTCMSSSNTCFGWLMDD